MNHLEFSFEETPWEAWLRTRKPGDCISAAQLLTMLEMSEDQALEDALQEIEMGDMTLDISELPKNTATGDAAVRLRQEVQLVENGLQLEALEENDPLRLFLEEVAGMPAYGDEQLLAADGAKGSESAMLQLTNLGLSRVIGLAQTYVGYGVLLLDLIQEGSLGLWQAIRNYTEGEYALHRDRWIRLYMAKAIVQQAHSNGVGQKLRTALADYRAVDERLLADLGRNPTLPEIAEELHLTLEEAETVSRMLDNARTMGKIHPKAEPPEPTADEEQAVENTALFRMRQRIADMLSELPREEQQLLILRFGLEGGLPLTIEQTASKLGLTPEDVVAREGAALAKLREKQ